MNNVRLSRSAGENDLGVKVEQDYCSFLHSLCYALKHRHAFLFSFLVKVLLYQKAICYVDNHMHINVRAYTKIVIQFSIFQFPIIHSVCPPNFA